MKADTFAKLVVLETLIDAEIGRFLELRPASMDGFREQLVARISDLVDEIDALDAVAAARVYDAVVDYLAALPGDEAGVVTATLQLKRALDRVVARGMDRREYDQAETWAVVLDTLLDALADEYRRAIGEAGELNPHEYLRAQVLLSRAAQVADRMLWSANVARRNELREQIDRLTFGIRHQRLPPAEIDQLIRPAQRRVRRYRPSTLTRVGSFVLSQLLSRTRREKAGGKPREQPGDQSHAPA